MGVGVMVDEVTEEAANYCLTKPNSMHKSLSCKNKPHRCRRCMSQCNRRFRMHR